jgi:hypothetical protein
VKHYCGIDLGKKSSHFHIIDGERKTVSAGKLASNVGAIRKVFASLDACGHVGLKSQAALCGPPSCHPPRASRQREASRSHRGNRGLSR